MAKVTVKEILSPALRKRLDALNVIFEQKLAKAISEKGLLEGQYERLEMDCKINYGPRDKSKYPRSSSNFGTVLIIWKMHRLWACWAPISNIGTERFEPVTGDSREDAITQFMHKYIIYKMNNSFKNSQDFNKWYKKYGSGKSKKNAV